MIFLKVTVFLVLGLSTVCAVLLLASGAYIIVTSLIDTIKERWKK